MENPVLPEAGLRQTRPCPDGRAAHPAASAGRNRQRRRVSAPSASPSPVTYDGRATSELDRQTTRTPSAGRLGIMTGIDRSGGALSPGRPILLPCRSEAACARGPPRQSPRPQERIADARDRARHQHRSTTGALRGFAPLEGVAGDGKPAPAQGKAFPLTGSCINAVALDQGTCRPGAVVGDRCRANT